MRNASYLLVNLREALYTLCFEQGPKTIMKRYILIVLTLVAVAFGAGYALNQSQKNPSPKGIDQSSQTTKQVADSPTSKVDDLITYTLPDGWQKQVCENSDAIYIIPSRSSANCDNNPIAPVKLSVDSGNKTDCNQLQNQTEVKKHTCISLFINGRKTLKASTEFLANSSYMQEMKVESYYFDTGSGIIKAEYFHTSSNEYQTSFDELANSINVK